jgi:hypothetical protein
MRRIQIQRLVVCLIVILTIINVAVSHAQTPPTEVKTVRIQTHAGNIYMGQVVSETESQVVLLSEEIGQITIERSQIRRLTVIDPSRIRNGVYWFENPHASRYIFSPSAFSVGEGKGYYQNFWIFFNSVNYGVNDNFSIGGGIIPMFLLGENSPAWVTPKYTFPKINQNFNFAVGALVGSVLGSSDFDTYGIFYGIGTYGNREKNISLGLGYGFSNGDVSSSPVINVGFLYRTSTRLYFISENYFFPNSDFNGLVSLGMRWTTENIAVDFSLMRPAESAGAAFIGFPLLGVTIPFGNK